MLASNTVVLYTYNTYCTVSQCWQVIPWSFILTVLNIQYHSVGKQDSGPLYLQYLIYSITVLASNTVVLYTYNTYCTVSQCWQVIPWSFILTVLHIQYHSVGKQDSDPLYLQYLIYSITVLASNTVVLYTYNTYCTVSQCWQVIPWSFILTVLNIQYHSVGKQYRGLLYLQYLIFSITVLASNTVVLYTYNTYCTVSQCWQVIPWSFILTVLHIQYHSVGKQDSDPLYLQYLIYSITVLASNTVVLYTYNTYCTVSQCWQVIPWSFILTVLNIQYHSAGKQYRGPLYLQYLIYSITVLASNTVILYTYNT